MNVTVGNVSSGSPRESSAQPAVENRRRSPADPGMPPGGARQAGQGQPPEPRRSAMDELRSRLLLLQRDVARAQRVLGGLEGIQPLLRSHGGPEPPDRSIREYAAGVTYRGEPVLTGLEERLGTILRERDAAGLQSLIGEARGHLGRLAQELSRYETAQQNTRAIAVGDDPLQFLKQGIRRAGGRLLEVQRENVLRLLG